MIDKIIESLESMAEDMRAMGDVEEASGVDSALWLIEEMTKKADTLQTNIPKSTLRTDCTGCRFVGTYDTVFPCANCVRKNKDYYDAEQTERNE